MGARGNSGVILSQILRGFAGTVKEHAVVAHGPPRRSPKRCRPRPHGAYEAVLRRSRARSSRSSRECAEAAKVAADADGSLVEVARARARGRQAWRSTTRPSCSRCSRTPAWSTPVGRASCCCSTPPCTSSTASPCPSRRRHDGAVGAAFEAVAHRHAADGELDVSEQRYEVMYFLELDDERIDDFKQGWGAIGDSIVVVGGDGLWNCHVHTNDIGSAIEVALDLGGRPKPDPGDRPVRGGRRGARREANCRDRTFGADRRNWPAVRRAPSSRSAGRRPRRVVREARRAGRRHRWADDEPVDGRTARHGARERRPGRRAAEQQEHHPRGRTGRRALREDGVVVPTRSMPEALAALVVVRPEASAAENAVEMSSRCRVGATGEVTRAVRDSTSGAGVIVEGRLDRSGAW
jgi:uncharacterized protein